MATILAAKTAAVPRRDDGGTGGWRTVGASMFALALGPSAIIILCFGVFLPALHAEFGWPVSQIALGGSISSLAIMLLAPIQGWLTDRYGGRRVILVSLPIWAVGLA
ncbi:MFS transporter, partial [uncultured Sphingomonas sp.]|uniref:MFS transporter n=1 Tax=uncultured Sphingomonas sp. TaxID=158754 RepID=UPI0035CBF726